MNRILFVIISLFSLASCSYTSGSGNIVSETRSVGTFTGISVGGSFDVEVRKGPVTEVRVEADDNIMKYIETSVSGNSLRIRTRDLHNYSDVHMKIFITTPSLTEVRASASAEIDIKDVLTGTGRLSFNASSSGTINGEVDAPEIETDASSGASINLSGKTRIHSAEASSGADIKTFDLLSENTRASASSGATVQVHASVSLKATASSGGNVEYRGAATVDRSESSGGSVERKD